MAQNGEGSIRVEQADSSVFSPTLLIGLGGTGAEVLMRVRKDLIDRGHDILNKFLLIDTDKKTFAGKAGHKQLTKNEKCFIGKGSVKAFLENRNSGYPGLKKRFPPNMLDKKFVRKLAEGTGAGQIRSLGALAFALDYMKIHDKISSVIRSLTSAQTRGQALAQAPAGVLISENSLIVYVVGSLAGGTGSGCLIDTAAVVRDIVNSGVGWDIKISGVFTLPDAYDEKAGNTRMARENLRSNTYAALKELQYLDDEEFRKDKSGEIEYVFGKHQKISVDRRIYDNIYLIDNKNSVIGTIDLEGLYQIVADSIYQDIGTSFGASTKGAEINSMIFSGIAVDPKSEKVRQFSSLGTSHLLYPGRRVANFCVNNDMCRIIADSLIGGTSDEDAIKKEVDQFLNDHKLDDRKPQDQILENLLEDRRVELDREYWSDTKDIDGFIKEMEDQLDYLDRNVKRDVSSRAEKKADMVISGSASSLSLIELVEEWSLMLASSRNIDFAIKAIKKLGNVARIICDQLSDEREHWDTHKQAYTSRFEHYHESLRKVGFFGKIGGNHKPIIENAVVAFNDYSDMQLRQWVKTQAIKVASHLADASLKIYRSWYDCRSTLESIYEDAEANYTKIEVSRDISSMNAIDITSSYGDNTCYERQYYDEHRIGTEKVLGELVKKHARTIEDSGNKDDYLQFTNWLYKTSINDMEPKITITSHISGLLEHTLWDAPLNQNIVDYIGPDWTKMDSALQKRLGMLFDKSEPYWVFGPQKPAASQGAELEDVFCITVNMMMKENCLTPPKQLEDWVRDNAPMGTYMFLHTSRKDAIFLNKRSHGARAYYLNSTKDMAAIYEDNLKRAQKARYMLSTHADYEDIPGLFPKDDSAALAFAKGMALGFIVKRGDWYYFGLQEKYDMKSGRHYLCIDYSGHWQTFHDLSGVPTIPEHYGKLWFRMKDENPPEELRLAQGRQAALEALEASSDRVTTIDNAFDEYYTNAGLNLKKQLAEYIESVLNPAAKKSTGSNKSVLQREIDALTSWAKDRSL